MHVKNHCFYVVMNGCSFLLAEEVRKLVRNTMQKLEGDSSVSNVKAEDFSCFY